MKQPTTLAPFSLLSLLALAPLSGAMAQDDVQVVPPPQTATTGGADEPLFMRSELVPHTRPGRVESMEEVMRREALREDRDFVNPKLRNGRQGSWRVPGIRRNYSPHSGKHYLFNKWGDTRMGIGFQELVDVEGAFVAGHGDLGGAFAKSLQAIGYRNGVEVQRSAVHPELTVKHSYFAIDLQDVDRIVIVAGPAYQGAGWYALDDFAFVSSRTGQREVLDFEDLTYEDVITGSGYAGLTWETGTGVFDDQPSPVFMTPPLSLVGPGSGQTSGPGGSAGAGQFGGGTYSGNGTLPVLLQKFQGPTMSDPGAGWTPPDTCGAVGVNHFVAVVNMHISIYEKATGTRVFSSSMQSFFGVGGNAGDPRVVFDPDSQRFIVIATDFNNDIYLAVSSASDPTGSWFKTSFNPATGSDAGKWPDYPTLGVDARWIMTSSYMVGTGSRMTLFAIEKAPLVAASQSMGTISAFRGLNWEGAIQPCVHWDDVGAAYAVSWRTSNQFRIRTINPPVTAPSMTSTFVPISKSWSSPPNAPVKGSSSLDTLDGRLMNSIFRGGSVWTTHSTNVNNRAACRYYEFDVATMSEVQLGTIRDTVNQSLYFWNPSIAVTADGHAVLGGTNSDANRYAGAFYTGRLATDPSGEMAEPVEYKPGQAAYNQGSRWGDYSLTTVDPVDDTIWTMQEFARTGNRWGNSIAQFDFPADCSTNITRYCSPSTLGPQIDVDTCSLGAGSINFTYSGGTPGQFGYLLVGSATGVITDPPGAVGDLCLQGAAIGRYTADLGVINAGGLLTTDVINGNTGAGTGQLPGSIGGAITAGSTWNWQYWARHTGVPSTFSDAISVTFTN